MVSAELQVRKAEAAAVLADFRREDDAFMVDQTGQVPMPRYGEWAGRLANRLQDLLAQLDAEPAEPSQLVAEPAEPSQLVAIRALLTNFNWERDDRQAALERIEAIAFEDGR